MKFARRQTRLKTLVWLAWMTSSCLEAPACEARRLPSGTLAWTHLHTGSWNSRTCRSPSAVPAGRETCSLGCTRWLHTAETRDHLWLGYVFGKNLQNNRMSGYLFLRTYSWSCRHHPVRKHVEIQTHQLEDVFKKADDLKSQHVLGRDKSHSKHNCSDNGDTIAEGEAQTCLQSSPTLKMAACQQILLASSSPFTSSSESERHCRPEGKRPLHTVWALCTFSSRVSSIQC